MPAIPLTLRALVLLPLLAVAVDQTRAVAFCGPGAKSCLEAAGLGWVGATGIALLAVYALLLALGVARLARGGRGDGRVPAGLRLWAAGSAGVAALCAGQALVGGAFGDPAALGGGWYELLALCAVAGGIIALALRVAPAAAALIRDLRPTAPRPPLALALTAAFPALPVRPARAPRTPATAGRAPPAR